MNIQTIKAPKPWYKKWWAITLFIFIGLGIIGSLGEDKTSSTKEVKNQPVQEKKVEVINITAERLRKDYKANQVSADSQYEDKLVELSGTVDTIGKDITDEAYITFETPEAYAFDKVQCMFKSAEEASLGTLKKGQTVVAQGTVSGVVISGPLVRNCKLILK